MVVKGLVHNDDPSAEKMWMPAGSFWTQPAGESHITAAIGEENIAYIEIDSGPYLVMPIEEAFDKGERPINIDKPNMVWVDASAGSKVAYLWGNQDKGELRGTLIKLSVGFNGKIITAGSIFHAMVIQGEFEYQIPNEEKGKSLDAGSYFTSKGKSAHAIVTEGDGEHVIYVRTNDGFKIISDK